MTCSDLVQIILMGLLVIVTGIYAWRTFTISNATTKQANANIKMAEEMREQRYDTVRPVIDINRDPADEDKMPEAIAASEGDPSRGLACVLHNIGLGPAIDLYSFVQNPFLGERQRHDFGTVPTEGKTYKMNLSVKHEDSQWALVAYYKDIYGRVFESSRKARPDTEKQGWEVGPLQIRPVKEDELP